MTHPIKQQLATDLDKVKAQSGTRVQRIKTIVTTAFSEAIAEVKDGGKEVKDTSKASLDNVLKTVLSQVPTAENLATTDSSSAESISEPISMDLAPGDATVTVAVVDELAATEPTAIPVMPNPETANPETAKPETAAQAAAPASTQADLQADFLADPQAEGETAPQLGSVVQLLLKAASLKAQAILGEQYGKLKAQLPGRYQQLQEKTTAWDGKLMDRYGDRYGTLKARSGKALAWYQDKLAQGRDLEANPLERKQAQKAEEISHLGVAFAQKEDALKQQIGQTLRTITVNAQS